MVFNCFSVKMVCVCGRRKIPTNSFQPWMHIPFQSDSTFPPVNRYDLCLSLLNVDLAIALVSGTLRNNSSRSLKGTVPWSLSFLAVLWNHEITMKKPELVYLETYLWPIDPIASVNSQHQ